MSIQEDLGYTKEKPDHKLVRPKNGPPNYQHEPEEWTMKRRAKNLEAIFKVFPEAEFDEHGFLSAELGLKKFQFWPSSDSWYSESKQRYGTGIERLCQRIEKLKSSLL